jgi:hypothetical protein
MRKGNGDFPRISPNNPYSSEVLLEIVNELKPDIVHVQFDPDLYGLILDSKIQERLGRILINFI